MAKIIGECGGGVWREMKAYLYLDGSISIQQ
jgi:hypothetical protein